MTRARKARLAGIAAFLLWPLSYAWIPLAERNPGWVLVVVVPLAEISAVGLGITAVWGGVQSRRDEEDSRAARWAMALGALTVTLVIAGNVVGLALLS